MHTESYDGRPVFGYTTEEIDGATVSFFYHLTPHRDRWTLGKYVAIGNGFGMTYECLGQDNGALIWDYLGPMTLNAATARFREVNAGYVHREEKK